jgi:hypothetical protein
MSWTEQDEVEARAFAKAFVALMLYARTQGIGLGFIGPGISIVNMEPGPPSTADQDVQLGMGSQERQS